MDRLEEKMSIAIPELPSADAGTHIPRSPELGASLEAVWAQAVENHERHSYTGDREGDIRFLALGAVGEAGELANFVKKRWRDGDGHDQAIKYEIADVCAYAFMLAHIMGQTPADLIATIAEKQAVFVKKMAARDMGSRVAAQVDQQPRDRPNTSLHSEEKEATR